MSNFLPNLETSSNSRLRPPLAGGKGRCSVRNKIFNPEK